MQRVVGASVSVEGAVIGSFEGPGLVVLIGVTHTDTPVQAERLAAKIHGLRIFESAGGEVSVGDLGLPVLVISQFTLYADTRKGRRPGWDAAAPSPIAEPLVNDVVEKLRELGLTIKTGEFGAHMQVSLTNDGPMTVPLEV